MSFKKVISIDINTHKKITQEIIGTSTHNVKTQYRVLSKNDFGVHKNRINIGLFNKKTDFRISEKDSIVLLNQKTMKIESPSIDNILKDSKNYFMLYKYSFHKRGCEILELIDKKSNTKYNINLSYEFGKAIINHVLKLTYDYSFSDEEKLFISNFIEWKNSFNTEEKDEFKPQLYSFNKYILINSNYKFLLGLSSIFLTRNIIPNYLNLYSIGLIFNLLEASYSIRKKNNDFILRYKFSPLLIKLLIKNDKKILDEQFHKIRQNKYFISDNKIILLKLNKADISKDIIGVNSGEIELISCQDIYFEKLENCSDKMYDLVMENNNAHNFWLNGLPLLHNSDGDIMAAFGVFTKEAASEAMENFSFGNKLKYINTANLEVQNFGVKTDSASGLFVATK